MFGFFRTELEKRRIYLNATPVAGLTGMISASQYLHKKVASGKPRMKAVAGCGHRGGKVKDEKSSPKSSPRSGD